MNKPETPEQTRAFHKLLRSDPRKYLETANQWIHEDPKDSGAYFDRHLAWMHVGEPQHALEDINKAIELDPQPVDFLARGDVYRHLGDYQKALEDYDQGEALNPSEWQDDEFGLLFQADCHGRLGHEAEALAYCARLPDNFWTPGLKGAPAGDKASIADQLRRMAAESRRMSP